MIWVLSIDRFGNQSEPVSSHSSPCVWLGLDQLMDSVESCLSQRHRFSGLLADPIDALVGRSEPAQKWFTFCRFRVQLQVLCPHLLEGNEKTQCLQGSKTIALTSTSAKQRLACVP
jgi:hypothetical protein